MVFICGKHHSVILSEKEFEQQFPMPAPKYTKFGDTLRKARKATRLSSSEFAKKIGVDWVKYLAFENGREIPDDDTQIKINQALFVSNL